MRKRINFLSWKLPVSLVHDTHREKEMETRIYSKEEAIDVAKKMARLDIKNRLPEDAKIMGENVLHQSVDNGKVTISIHFQVIENIATGEANYPRRVRMTEELKTMNVQLNNSNEAIALIGNSDANLKVIEQELGVSIITRGETVYVSGDLEQVELVGNIVDALLYVIRKGINISQRDVIYAIQMAKKGTLDYFKDLFEEEIAKNAKGKSIRVKTIGQRHYISAMKKSDLVFGIGPAGTGKTYLAVVMAVNALKTGQVKRIILTRPAVEAGESLGFLPGDLKGKG